MTSMTRTILLSLAAASALFAASFTGTITDSGCAKADHKAMNMGTDEQCVKACVKAHGATYVLWDGRKTYELSDQKTPEQFAAKKVMVEGTLDAKTNTIKVASIKAAQ
jgi:xylose isomerase